MEDSRISEAIGIVREELEEYYPDKVVKSAESGECDVRVSSTGASIFVNAYNGLKIDTEVIDNVVERSEEELDGRVLEYQVVTDKWQTGDVSDKFRFDLKS